MQKSTLFIDHSIVIPQERPMMRVATSRFHLQPEWEEKIDTYSAIRARNVKENFRAKPFLFNSFYEFMGRLPKEVQDIAQKIDKGDAKGALDEIDDLIDKTMEWRMKLSQKLSID